MEPLEIDNDITLGFDLNNPRKAIVNKRGRKLLVPVYVFKTTQEKLSLLYQGETIRLQQEYRIYIKNFKDVEYICFEGVTPDGERKK